MPQRLACVQPDADLPALAVCPRGRELTLRSAICAHRTMITAPRLRHPGKDWVLCRVHVGRSRHCSSWCPERGIGRWPGRRYGRGRGQRLPEPDSHAHDGARGRGPVVSRVGLGLAALGRPTYITSGREEDLPGRSVAGMRTRTFSMLDAAYAAGVDPADAQEIRTLRTSVGGTIPGAKFKPRGVMRGMRAPCLVRLSPRSYAIWATLLWTCLT